MLSIQIFVGEIVYEDKWQIAVKVEEGRMI